MAEAGTGSLVWGRGWRQVELTADQVVVRNGPLGFRARLAEIASVTVVPARRPGGPPALAVRTTRGLLLTSTICGPDTHRAANLIRQAALSAGGLRPPDPSDPPESSDSSARSAPAASWVTGSAASSAADVTSFPADHGVPGLGSVFRPGNHLGPVSGWGRTWRLWRDWVVVAAGIGLLGFNIVAGAGVFGYLVALALIALGGVAALLHHLGIRRDWPRRIRWLFTAIGFVWGAYLLVGGIAVGGPLAQHAVGIAQDCAYSPAHGHVEAFYGCQVTTHWPDGTSGAYLVNLDTGNGTTVDMANPPAALRWFFAPDQAPSFTSVITYILLGVLVFGQSLLSLTLLLTGRPARPVGQSPTRPLGSGA